MIINENSFTYQDMLIVLSDKEIKLLLELIRFMNDDNFIYLYQKSQRKRPTIDLLVLSLGISRKTIQNLISSILDKQYEDRYFLVKVQSGIKGEYFISPELVVKQKHCYETIYREIVPKMKKQLDKRNTHVL